MGRYWQDAFWRNNVIFLAGSLFVAFINYLYYPVLGRLMDIGNFGEVQTILSIFNLVGVLLMAFQIVVINVTANDKKEGLETVRQFEHFALLTMAAIAIIITTASVGLQDFFNFKSPSPFIVLALALIVSVLTASRRSFVQGKNNFLAASVSNSIGALGKLLISAVLVLIGLQTFGAIIGILIAQVLAFVYIAHVAKKMGFSSGAKKQSIFPDLNLLKPEAHYLLAVLAVFIVVTLLYSGDMLVVKRYFEPFVAGQYAGISAIANIIFFATASFAAVLLSSVGQAYPEEHNRLNHKKSLLLVASIGGVILLIFSIVPELVISLLIGSRYVDYAHLLPLLSLVTFLVSIVNLYFYYFLALRRYIIVPIAITGGTVTFVLTVVNHGSLESVIYNFLAGIAAVLALIAITTLPYRLITNRGTS